MTLLNFRDRTRTDISTRYGLKPNLFVRENWLKRKCFETEEKHIGKFSFREIFAWSTMFDRKGIWLLFYLLIAIFVSKWRKLFTYLRKSSHGVDYVFCNQLILRDNMSDVVVSSFSAMPEPPFFCVGQYLLHWRR